MDLDLGEKRAVITGGSRGIGKSIAVVLASEGAEVAICGRNKDSLEQAAADILKETGKSILAVVADTTNTASVESFIGAAADHLGGIDILVNNAAAPGGLVMGPLNTANPDELLADLDTKVVGYMRVAKAAAPYLKEGGWGRIINIGGLAARSGGAISGMRNVALTHFTKTLSNELGPQGINVNIIHPGATRTERTGPLNQALAKERNVSVKDVENAASAGIDIRRLIESEEVAFLAAFLASPKSSAITGEAIAAGGGVGSAVFQ